MTLRKLADLPDEPPAKRKRHLDPSLVSHLQSMSSQTKAIEDLTTRLAALEKAVAALASRPQETHVHVPPDSLKVSVDMKQAAAPQVSVHNHVPQVAAPSVDVHVPPPDAEGEERKPKVFEHTVHRNSMGRVDTIRSVEVE